MDPKEAMRLAKLAKRVRAAIKAECGDPDITLGQVHRTYGKRLVIIVSELDSEAPPTTRTAMSDPRDGAEVRVWRVLFVARGEIARDRTGSHG